MSQSKKEQIEELFMECEDGTTMTVKSKCAINPDHYKIGGIETIDYMKAKSTPEEFYGHLRLTALKYISRAGYKDDALQDFKKAKWYLERLISELTSANS